MSYTFNSILVRALTNPKEFKFINKIPDVLFNEVETNYIKAVNDFVSDYGRRPTVEIITENYKAFRLDYLDEGVPLEYAVDVFLSERRNKYIKDQIGKAQTDGKDIYEPGFLEDITKKSAPKRVDILDYNEFDRSEHFNVVGKIDFGIKWFDDTFGGLWNTDYNIIFGSLGNGKTTLLLYLLHILNKYKGKNILVFSNEMPAKTFISKLDALACGINPKLFRSLNFSDTEKAKLISLNSELKTGIATIKVAGALSHPNEILPIIENQDRPIDIIAIDGLHLVGKGGANNVSEKSVQLGEVSRMIRLFTLQNEIPIIAVAQGNREAAKTDEPKAEHIGLSYAMMQDVDNAITSTKVEVNGKAMFKYFSAKNRYDDQSSIYAEYDWDNMKVVWKQLADLEQENF